MASVTVLCGGTSNEREISLLSGKAVFNALQQAGHQVSELDPADGLESIIGQLKDVDMVFPVLHGAAGEDGVLQKFLEDNSVPFVGSGSQASALCFDKARYAKLLEQESILGPETYLVDAASYSAAPLSRQPHVLKPNDGGSSIDTFIVRDPAQADHEAIADAFTRYPKLLLQSLIVGTEITVAVVGNTSLPVIEIIPPVDKEFDYENKYNGATQELCPPKNVSEEAQRQAQALSLHIHQMAGCRDMSRTDIIITADGKQYVLETNTIPGMTDQSLLPKAAATAGIPMPALCDQLVRSALERAGSGN